jgi:hypothetical protein
VRAARLEAARQLPGAGREVDDDAPGAQTGALQDPVDRLRRVLRPRPLVELGDGRERVRVRVEAALLGVYVGVTR